MTTVGCGASAAPSVARDVRLAVLPVAWQTRDPLPDLDERAPLLEGMRTVSVPSVEPVEPSPACDPEDTECAREAGREAAADRVVVSSMAALGSTVLARVSVVDVGAGTREETRQRVVRDVDEGRVREALVELGRLVVAPYAPAAGVEWYEEPWVWTVTGAALVGGAIAIALSVALSGAQGPDVVVTPP